MNSRKKKRRDKEPRQQFVRRLLGMNLKKQEASLIIRCQKGFHETEETLQSIDSTLKRIEKLLESHDDPFVPEDSSGNMFGKSRNA